MFLQKLLIYKKEKETNRIYIVLKQGAICTTPNYAGAKLTIYQDAFDRDLDICVMDEKLFNENFVDVNRSEVEDLYRKILKERI